MTRGKRLGIVAGVAFVVGAAHYGWFSIFGPPARWGTGVEDVDAKFAAAGSASPYAMGDSVRADSVPNSIPDEERRASGVMGRLLQVDVFGPSGYSLLQTHAGKYWSEGQHLYFRRNAAEKWREIHLPPDFRFSNPKLVRIDGRVVAVVARWNSWWPHDYGRFWLSLIRPPLRAEYSVYAVDLGSGGVRYLFPGHSVVLAPNREFAAYMGSENGLSGFHTIRIWKIGRGESKPVLSLYEADPGSGSSFSYRWTTDSKGLLIGGSAHGFSGSRARGGGDFQFVYSVEQDAFFDLSSKTSG